MNKLIIIEKCLFMTLNHGVESSSLSGPTPKKSGLATCSKLQAFFHLIHYLIHFKPLNSNFISYENT